ncbi:MAG: hypothetical protein V4459_10875 [Pseudomonadota bacterium]
MGLRIFFAGAMLASLGACGESTDDKAANDATPANKVTEVVAGGPMDCSKLPDFVPLYADAKVSTCVSGGGVDPGHESGTVIYTVPADPAAVIAWYKGKADSAGLVQSISTDTMYAAREGSKRTIMTMTEKVATGTKVTVNWGRDL